MAESTSDQDTLVQRSVGLRPDQWEALAALKQRKQKATGIRVTVSALVKIAVEQYLRRQSNTDPTERDGLEAQAA